MGQKNSKLNLDSASNNSLCDEECQKKKMLNNLELQKKNIDILNNTNKEKLNELNQKINKLKYSPSKLNSINFNTKMNIINSELTGFDKNFNQLIGELETRINLFLKQFNFFNKNNLVLKDLERNLENKESSLKKKKNEFNKIDRQINNIQKDNQVLENKLNRQNTTFIILISIIIISIILIVYLIKVLKKKDIDIKEYLKIKNIPKIILNKINIEDYLLKN